DLVRTGPRVCVVDHHVSAIAKRTANRNINRTISIATGICDFEVLVQRICRNVVVNQAIALMTLHDVNGRCCTVTPSLLPFHACRLKIWLIQRCSGGKRREDGRSKWAERVETLLVVALGDE